MNQPPPPYNAEMVENEPENDERRLVIAIDYGTTFTGNF